MGLEKFVFELGIEDCDCIVWFPFDAVTFSTGVGGVETIISQFEDAVSLSAKFMNAVSNPSPHIMVSASKSLTVVEPVIKLEMRVSFPGPPSIVSNPEPP